MLRIAHRGASALAPENTLAAIRCAIELGIPWVEVDVQACADGLVVIHDTTLERTTSGHGPVAMQTVETLRRLDAGHGERIPLPQEVLDLCRGRCAVNLELKGPQVAPRLLPLLARALAGDWPAEALLCSSFDWPQLQALRAALPGLMLGVLCRRVDDAAVAMATTLRARVIACALERADAAAVAAAHGAGCALWVYTVNEATTASRLAALGVDAVFSDRPQAV
ncbi:MAG: glycerophosphodiester phosphodiesterase [Immundisolibacter sp.]